MQITAGRMDRLFACACFAGLLLSVGTVFAVLVCYASVPFLSWEVSTIAVLLSLGLILGEIKGYNRQLAKSAETRRLLVYLAIWSLSAQSAFAARWALPVLLAAACVLVPAAAWDFSHAFKD